MFPGVASPICPNQVVGVKDSRMGEEICVCIRVRAGQDCAEEEIKAFCKGKVSLPVLSSLPDQHTQQLLGTYICKGQGFRATEDPALAVPAWVVPAGLTMLFPTGCVAVSFLFPDLPFQNPTVCCVCGSVPTHCLGQGKSESGKGAGQEPWPPVPAPKSLFLLLSVLSSRFRNTS